jgi:hypothetical protein
MKCGCFYTISADKLWFYPDEELHPTERICQNCGQPHTFDPKEVFLRALPGNTNAENPYEIEIIPDNAKITITFNP